MKIALTKCERNFQKYEKWLDYFGIQYDSLEYSVPVEDISDYSGLILTGGIDIYPELYNDWEDAKDAGTYIPERDGFELNLIKKALAIRLPVLGICRGCQLLNVYFRGNLIYDLPSIRGVNHGRLEDGSIRFHDVSIYSDTLLSEILKINEGIVTSTHHQAVDRLGEGLKVSAKSKDGVVEAIEYAEKQEKNFLLGVQWHPEQFEDYSSPFSENVILKFKDELR